MFKDRFSLFMGILLLSISGCVPQQSGEPFAIVSPLHVPTTTTQVTEILTNSSTPLPAITPSQPLSVNEGPLLLLQTDFYEYQYLNPITQSFYPVDLPISDPQFRLRANLSPSGTQMFFPMEDGMGLIVELRTNHIIQTYDFSSPSMFDPQLAATEARPYVTGLELTEEALLAAVNEAYQKSKQIIRWYQSDRYHLVVRDADQTSTNLYLDDHQTGTKLRLEDQPGLVNDFRVGPDGNLILLKKGLVFKPGAWGDNRYYLIDVNNQTTQPLPITEGDENHVIFWISEDTLGVIHQPFMSGGMGFSTINTATMDYSLIYEDIFTDLRQYDNLLLFIRLDSEVEATFLELVSHDGKGISSQKMNATCFYHSLINGRLIFNCEQESLVLDDRLNIEIFSDPLLILSPAPDAHAIVLVNRAEKIFLLDDSFHIQHELLIDEMPLEINWLPDSTGFLYRTLGQLYLYDLSSKNSHLLLKSDLFGDYTNLNAVWLDLE
jgi:hypothetical protein